MEMEDSDSLGENMESFGWDDLMDGGGDVGESSASNTLWDFDTDDLAGIDGEDVAMRKSNSNGSIMTKNNSDQLKIDPGDESENERDHLAVLDSLLALYDPEISKLVLI